jgi:hypothetical protein
MPDHADAANQTDLLALDPRLQYIFESEVLHQWAFTVRSVAMMNDALQRADLDAFWFAMDAALGSLANISKVFFPPGSRSQARRRGRQMREAFGVQDDSLLKERALRDAFEHFDERIDRRFQHDKDRPFADRNVAPPGGIVIGRWVQRTSCATSTQRPMSCRSSVMLWTCRPLSKKWKRLWSASSSSMRPRGADLVRSGASPRRMKKSQKRHEIPVPTWGAEQ